MDQHPFPLQIYPSQLASFKGKAKIFALKIGELSGTKPLSAFKQNDYLSIGIGYKGHSDLIKSAEFRADGDNNESLEMFRHDLIRSSIVEVFVAKLPKVDANFIEQAALVMAEYEVIQANTTFKIPMIMDEASAYCSESFSNLLVNQLTDLSKRQDAETWKDRANRMLDLTKAFTGLRNEEIEVIRNRSEVQAAKGEEERHHRYANNYVLLHHTFVGTEEKIITESLNHLLFHLKPLSEHLQQTVIDDDYILILPTGEQLWQTQIFDWMRQ